VTAVFVLCSAIWIVSVGAITSFWFWMLGAVLAVAVVFTWLRRPSLSLMAQRADAKGNTSGLLFAALHTPKLPLGCGRGMHSALHERANRSADDCLANAIGTLATPWKSLLAITCGVLAVVVGGPKDVPTSASAPDAFSRPSSWFEPVAPGADASQTFEDPDQQGQLQANEEVAVAPPELDKSKGDNAVNGSPSDGSQQGVGQGTTGETRDPGEQREDRQSGLTTGATELGQSQTSAPKGPSNMEDSEAVDPDAAESTGAPELFEADRATKRGTATGARGENQEVAKMESDKPLEEQRVHNPTGSSIESDQIQSPMLLSINDELTWSSGFALPGSGGISDAGGTADTRVAPATVSTEALEETWIDARWRQSAAGLVRTIEGGQTGGQSAMDYQDAFDAYVSVAESEIRQEQIPPGRAIWIRDYFYAIRLAEQETP